MELALLEEKAPVVRRLRNQEEVSWINPLLTGTKEALEGIELTMEDVKDADGWLERTGRSAVFFCRFVPIIRSLISIPAGMAKMELLPFLLLTTAGQSYLEYGAHRSRRGGGGHRGNVFWCC